MKRLTLSTLIVLLAAIGVSQNYQCINDNTIYYFEDDYSIKVISIDSVATESDGLAYYNYTTLAGTQNFDCFWQYGPSWVGRKMIAKPDGDNVFFNLEDKAITIKTQKEVGEYWVCYEFFTGYHIEATVSDIQYMNFLGITDLVKKITFQAMGSNGVPAIHPVNNMFLLLSENHGLVRTVNFKVFPDLYDQTWEEECHEYELCGMENPSVGKQNLTTLEIFNLNIGDEYHTNKYQNNWIAGDFNQEIMIYTIIDKYVSPGYDTLSYQAGRCGKIGELVNNEIKYLYYNDTIEFSYYPHLYDYLDTITEKLIVYDFGDFRDYVYNTQYMLDNSERMGKRHWTGLYSQAPHDCIEMIVTDDKNPGYGDTYFIEGLGGPYWNFEYFWEDYHHLVYYKIGDEEWGTPYNCDSLLVSVENIKNYEREAKICPNPMTERSIITFDNKAANTISFHLYNLHGVKLKEIVSNGEDIILERNKLLNGIYIYMLYEENKLIHSGKLIVK